MALHEVNLEAMYRVFAWGVVNLSSGTHTSLVVVKSSVTDSRRGVSPQLEVTKTCLSCKI